MNRAAHDERKNVRPYVLGACFVWGLVCGFFFYVLRDAPSPVPDKPQTKVEPAKQPDGSDAPPNGGQAKKDPEPVEDTTPILDVPRENYRDVNTPNPTKPERAVADPEPAKKTVRLTAEAPKPAPIVLNPAWGLTGLTTRPPQKPVVTPDKKGPSSAISGGGVPQPLPVQPPKKIVPLKLDDLPELDL